MGFQVDFWRKMGIECPVSGIWMPSSTYFCILSTHVQIPGMGIQDEYIPGIYQVWVFGVYQAPKSSTRKEHQFFFSKFAQKTRSKFATSFSVLSLQGPQRQNRFNKRVLKAAAGRKESCQPPADKSFEPRISHAHHWSINACMCIFFRRERSMKATALGECSQVPCRPMHFAWAPRSLWLFYFQQLSSVVFIYCLV